jgi:hypothetical protein
MNTVHGAIFGLALALCGGVCSAQQVTIPFEQIQKDSNQNTQLVAGLALPGSESEGRFSSSNIFSETLHTEPVMSGFVRVPAGKSPRVLDSKFFLFQGMHLAMAVLDVETTQQCLAAHTCREGNPLMPSSQAGALGVNFALVGYSSYVSYRLRTRKSSLWWLSPTTGTVAHVVGVATGLSHMK